MLKTVSSVTNAIGALNYKGTWDASINSPTLTSSVGTKGDYYVVSVAGNTNLNGETLWGVGDWAVFNGSIWQKVDGGDTSVVTSLTVTTLTGYMYANNTSAVTASTTIPNTAITGLGTMSTQNANAVVITGGTINSTTQTNGTYSNANITSVAVTFPNSYLANSSVVIGNTTVALGGTATSVGNLTLANVTISSGNATVNNANLTYANISTALRTQGLTGYLYGNANTGNVSASTTIPNAGLANANVIVGNTTIALGSTVTNIGNLTLANANLTSVASTFPNSYLSNSSVTLGSTSVSLGSTASTVSGLTLSTVTISSGNSTVTNSNATYLAIAGAAISAVNNKRVTISNSYDATELVQIWTSTSLTLQSWNSGFNCQTYGTGWAGYFANSGLGVAAYAGNSYLYAGGSGVGVVLGAWSGGNGFTSNSVTFTTYATVTSTGIGIGRTPSYGIDNATTMRQTGSALFENLYNQQNTSLAAYYVQAIGGSYTTATATKVCSVTPPAGTYGRITFESTVTNYDVNFGFSMDCITTEVLFSLYGGVVNIIKTTVLSNNQASINAGIINVTATSSANVSSGVIQCYITPAATGTVGATNFSIATKVEVTSYNNSLPTVTTP